MDLSKGIAVEDCVAFLVPHRYAGEILVEVT